MAEPVACILRSRYSLRPSFRIFAGSGLTSSAAAGRHGGGGGGGGNVALGLTGEGATLGSLLDAAASGMRFLSAKRLMAITFVMSHSR